MPQSDRRSPILWIFVALAGGGFITLSVMVLVRGGLPFDTPVYELISRLISPALTRVVIILTQTGDVPVLVPLTVVAVALLWWRGHPSLGVLITVNLASAALVNKLIKQLIQRPRPSLEQLFPVGGYSFPSGHSFTSMAFYGLLIYLVFRLCYGRWKWVACTGLGVLILAIGLSRIYLGVHYASDVAAGFCGGFLWVTAITQNPVTQRVVYLADRKRYGR